ncbi:MAG: DUF1232 domain-containing protein [Proteobacteria bacterium]|nr:DUF1232 domain-containing protein [Pseudomonadota bacterium]
MAEIVDFLVGYGIVETNLKPGVRTVSEYMQSVKEWVRSFRGDVEVVKSVVSSSGVDKNARKFAASALNYLVTRLDLVPDWNPTIGLIDDVMVLRVCLRLANAYSMSGHLDEDVRGRVEQLIDDVDIIETFLGDELYGKLRKYCARLSETTVRGRSPETIVADQNIRQTLFDEIGDDILRMPPASFENPDDVAIRFTSYLHHKLA